MITTKCFLLVGVVGCLLFASDLCAETQPQASQMFSNLTLAVERGDYASFALESDEQLRHDITPTAFQTLHEQLRPRMERGFETRCLGCLEQRAGLTHQSFSSLAR